MNSLNLHPLGFSEREVEALTSRFTSDDKVLEYGSGWSTAALSKQVEVYNSVEHDFKWYTLLNELEQDTFNIVHAKCEYTDNYIHCEYDNEDEKNKWRDYFTGARHFKEKYYTKVFIDGRARVYCALDALQYIDNNSLVFIHDFGRSKYYERLKEHYTLLETIDNLGILKKK